MKESERTDVLVIGGDHYNTLGVIRSLGEAGLKVNVILIAKRHRHILQSRYVNSVWVIKDENELINLMLDIAHELKQYFIVYPTSDMVMRVIDENQNKLRSHYSLPNIDGREGSIRALMDKLVMNQVASEVGLSVPRTWELDLHTSLKAPLDIVYPCIIKPITSFSGKKEDITICYSDIEFQNAASRLASNYKKIMLQEYISSTDERMIEVIGCSFDDGHSVVVPGVIEKIREYPLHAGSTSYAKLVNSSCYIDTSKVKELMREIRYNGIFDLELKYSNGNTYFIEVNFRTGAPNYAVTRAGVNLPYLWYLKALGKSLEVDDLVIDKNVFLMSELRDVRHVVDKKLSFISWIRDLVKARSFLYFNIKDLRPFISKLKGK